MINAMFHSFKAPLIQLANLKLPLHFCNGTKNAEWEKMELKASQHQGALDFIINRRNISPHSVQDELAQLLLKRLLNKLNKERSKIMQKNGHVTSIFFFAFLLWLRTPTGLLRDPMICSLVNTYEDI